MKTKKITESTVFRKSIHVQRKKGYFCKVGCYRAGKLNFANYYIDAKKCRALAKALITAAEEMEDEA